MSKAKESIKWINEISDSGYESLRELGDIALNAWSQALAQQLETYGTLMNSGLEQIERIAKAREYHEVVRNQLELNRKLGETVLDKTRDVVELNRKTGDEIRAWFERGLASANEPFAKAAEKTA